MPIIISPTDAIVIRSVDLSGDTGAAESTGIGTVSVGGASAGLELAPAPGCGGIVEQAASISSSASDLFALAPMARAAKRNQARLVFDSRELYPHLDSFVGRPWVRMFWSAVERRYIKHTDLVFTVNRSIAVRMVAAHGIETPVVLHNVTPRQEVRRTNKLR